MYVCISSVLLLFSSYAVLYNIYSPGKDTYKDLHKDTYSRCKDTCKGLHKDTLFCSLCHSLTTSSAFSLLSSNIAYNPHKDTYKDTYKDPHKGTYKDPHKDTCKDPHRDTFDMEPHNLQSLLPLRPAP